MKPQLQYIFLAGFAFFVLIVSGCKGTSISITNETITSTPTSLSHIPAPTNLSPAHAGILKLLWSYQTNRAIWGSPSVSKGIAYIGSDDGNLYAVEVETGNLEWKFPTQGIVRSQPAIDGGLVYFSSDDGYLYALKAEAGELAWRTDIGNALPRDAREKLGTNTNPTGWDYKQSTPVVLDGQVYIGSLDGNIYALQASSGQIIWKYRTNAKVRATPVIDNGVLYIGSWDECFYALDAASGQMYWKTPVGGEVQSTALLANGLIYTASRKASVVALNAQTGKLSWEFDYGTNIWVESSPIIKNDVVYIGSAGNKWVVGLNSLTGETVTSFFSNTYFMSTPTLLGDTLVIGGATFRKEGEGGLFIIKLEDGHFADSRHPLLFFPVEESLEIEGNWNGVMSSPVVQDGVAFFGGLDGKLYAVSLEY